MPGRLATYAITALAAFLAAGFVLKLWESDPFLPLFYDGDGILHELWLKTHIEKGWFAFNERFGAPGGMDLNEFPQADLFHYLLLWPVCQLSRDPSFVYNFYYILGFPLAACSCLFLLRRLHISFLPALGASVLFACLPYHFFRAGHFFLAAYYTIPWGIWLALLVFRGERLPRGPAIAVAAVTGMAGAYYAFFACFFLVLAGLSRALTVRSFRPLLPSALLCAGIFAALMVSVAPALLHKRTQPHNPDATERYASHSEVLGLKMMNLLLPATGHRVTRFDRVRQRYYDAAPLTNENANAALGVLGSLGFLYLLGRFLVFRTGPTDLNFLSLLALGGFLLGTIGGLGSAFAFFGSPWIRGYNRISVFLALFAIAGVALLLDHWLRNRKRGELAAAMLIPLFLAALLDQTTRGMAPKYPRDAARYRSDRAFVAEIESKADAGGIVYMLPFRPFPEAGGEEEGIRFTWYDQLRPELHSRTLRWTAGAPRGRLGDAWIRRMEAKELPDRVRALVDAECAGIMVFREAYSDSGAELEKELKRLTGASAIASEDKRISYFKLKDAVAKRKAELGPEGWAKANLREATPVLPFWGKGAGSLFERDGVALRFCSSGSELRIHNPTDADRRVRIKLRVQLPEPREGARLAVRGIEGAETEIVGRTASFECTIDAPPGDRLLHVDCLSVGRTHHFEAFAVECEEK